MVFEYTSQERIIMAFITGISNFGSVPAMYYVYKKQRYYEAYIGLFTFITSFLYHVCESLESSFYLEQDRWHILDNIGSICCLNSLIINLMKDGKSHHEQLKLNLSSLFLVITMQTKDPWDLYNTVFPLIVFTVVLFYDFYKRGVPKYNKEAIKKGCSIAISMFIKGLNDGDDYLRIAHSLWHITIGWSTFYLWQLQEEEIEDYLTNYKLFLNII